MEVVLHGEQWTGGPVEEGLSLLDYLRVVRRRARMIALLVGVSVLLALAYSLLSPRIYESTASILAPKEGASMGLASTLLAAGALPMLPTMGTPSLSPNRDLFVNVLKSRTLAQAAVEEFKLRERYRSRFLSDAVKVLQDRATISASKIGVISIRVEETDPQLAAAIANFYSQKLDDMVKLFKTSEATKQKIFLTSRVAETLKDLRQAEEALRSFQETHKAVALQDQAKSAVEGAAQLKGQIVAAQVQLEVLRNYANEENPEVVKFKREIEEMKHQLAEMQYGEGLKLTLESAVAEKARTEIHVSFAELPELVLQLARLMREVKVQETVYTLLTQDLEQAKIQEARDLPTVQVLDRAVPAERKSRPRTLVNLVLATAGSSALGVFLAFALAYLEASKKRTLPLHTPPSGALTETATGPQTGTGPGAAPAPLPAPALASTAAGPAAMPAPMTGRHKKGRPPLLN